MPLKFNWFFFDLSAPNSPLARRCPSSRPAFPPPSTMRWGPIGIDTTGTASSRPSDLVVHFRMFYKYCRSRIGGFGSASIVWTAKQQNKNSTCALNIFWIIPNTHTHIHMHTHTYTHTQSLSSYNILCASVHSVNIFENGIKSTSRYLYEYVCTMYTLYDSSIDMYNKNY